LNGSFGLRRDPFGAGALIEEGDSLRIAAILSSQGEEAGLGDVEHF
jgi:hypothetical protein